MHVWGRGRDGFPLRGLWRLGGHTFLRQYVSLEVTHGQWNLPDRQTQIQTHWRKEKKKKKIPPNSHLGDIRLSHTTFIDLFNSQRVIPALTRTYICTYTPSPPPLGSPISDYEMLTFPDRVIVLMISAINLLTRPSPRTNLEPIQPLNLTHQLKKENYFLDLLYFVLTAELTRQHMF